MTDMEAIMPEVIPTLDVGPILAEFAGILDALPHRITIQIGRAHV